MKTIAEDDEYGSRVVVSLTTLELKTLLILPEKMQLFENGLQEKVLNNQTIQRTSSRTGFVLLPKRS